MFNYGNITDSSESRLYRVLTDKGLREYRNNIKAGLTPRQSLRKVRDASREATQKHIERNKQFFIDYVLPLVKLSIEDYINLLGRDLKTRWLQYPEKQLKPILKNWRAKTLDEAIANYVKKEMETWDTENNVFRRQHIRYFEEAIFYGLPYNIETYKHYKNEIKELILPKHSSVFDYVD